MRTVGKKRIPMILLMCIVMALAACGGNTENKNALKESIMAYVSVPQTEKDYREEIAKLGDSKEDLEKSALYYEELLARDLFAEEDSDPVDTGDGEDMDGNWSDWFE